MTELAPDPELLPTADEATTLHAFLDFYRSILIRKAEGIGEEQRAHGARPIRPHASRIGAAHGRGGTWLVPQALHGPRRAVPHTAATRRSEGTLTRDFHPSATDTVADALTALQVEIDFGTSVERRATDGHTRRSRPAVEPDPWSAAELAVDPRAPHRGVRRATAATPTCCVKQPTASAATENDADGLHGSRRRGHRRVGRGGLRSHAIVQRRSASPRT